MAKISVAQPFKVFTGTDGLPIENGQIYIGLENSNAETAPQTVYWDSALSTPATQPIRTIGGMPYRNGSPAQVYVTANYSITVRDKNGALVYSSLSESATSGVTQWLDPDYSASRVSNTQFTVTGDQTAEYTTDRRIQFVDPAGTKYATVSTSAYAAPLTTVTVVVDAAGTIDAGLSEVSLSILTPTNDAIPRTIPQLALANAFTGANTFSAVQTFNNRVDFETGANIASAATVDFTAATGNTVNITGAVGTTAVTMNNGQLIWAVANGAWPLTYHATNLNLPGARDYTCAAGDRLLFHYDGTTKRVLYIIPANGSYPSMGYIHCQEQQAAGTNGSDSVGATWSTRVLNTTVSNSITGASLAANQVTLPAGTYYIMVHANCYTSNNHQSRLYNVTDTAVALLGTTERTVGGTAISTSSFVSGFITLAAAKALAVQHNVATGAFAGFGLAANLGTEVYCNFAAIRVA